MRLEGRPGFIFINFKNNLRVGQVSPEDGAQLTILEVLLEAYGTMLCFIHGLTKTVVRSHLCCVLAACDVSCWTQGGSFGSEGLKDCDHRTGQTGFTGPEKARK